MRFENWHPVNGFLYFIIVAGGTILCMHPLLLFASFFSASVYLVYCVGWGRWLKSLKILLPILIFFTILNPLFNHQGVTVIGYFRENPVTAESVYYGFFMAVMVSSVILWLHIYHEHMGSDKWMCLFGGFLPTLSLLFSMALRIVPKISMKAKQIGNARKGLGTRALSMDEDYEKERLRVKGKGFVKGNERRDLRKKMQELKKEMYTLTAWSLEDSMDTAISMKSRGYGLKRRSTYSIYKMRGMDVTYLVLFIVFFVALAIGIAKGFMTTLYFPRIRFPKMNHTVFLLYTGYFLFLNVPIVSDILEGIKWRYLQSRI